MSLDTIAAKLNEVQKSLYLLDDYISAEDKQKLEQLTKEIEAIYQSAVDALKCGRVG